MNRVPVSLLLACSLVAAHGCAFSRTVVVSSEPAGAKIWLANQPVGRTPQEVRVPTTGPFGLPTHDATFVTLEFPGFERTVRRVRYRWSARNTAASLLLLGIPLIFFAEEPVDTHVQLSPEDP